MLVQDNPGAKKNQSYSLALARKRLEEKGYAEAASLAVLVLESSGDRTNPKLRKEWMPNPTQAANRRHLSLVSVPPSDELVIETLTILQEASVKQRAAKKIPKEEDQQTANTAWLDAYKLSFEHWKPYHEWPQRWNWKSRWNAVAKQFPKTAYAALAELAIGQRLRAGGFFHEAEKQLLKVLERYERYDSIHARALLELALFYKDSWGEWEPALAYIAKAERSDDPFVRESARYAHAEILESTGQFENARRLFSSIAAEAASRDLSKRAAYSLNRLDTLKALHPANDGQLDLSTSPVVYLGEDRQTQGDWRNRGGEDAFVLCAMLCPADVRGGLHPIRYRPYMADTGKRCAYWSTDLHDMDPSALVDPIVMERSFFNWDDAGELRDLGEGPDLGVDLFIPAGTWRATFYFVNEYNYMEPSRKYNLYILDKESRFLAGCTVEQHLNGVYKQFAVDGPINLKLRLTRNLSLNTLLQGVFLDKLEVVPEQINFVEKVVLQSRTDLDGRFSDEVTAAFDYLKQLKGSEGRFLFRRLGKTREILSNLLVAESVQRRSVVARMKGLFGESSDRPSEPPTESVRYGLAWPLASVLNNEPSTAQQHAGQFFASSAAVLSPDEVERWLESEEKRWIDASRITRARTTTLARIAVDESLRGPVAHMLPDQPEWERPRIKKYLGPYHDFAPFGNHQTARDLEFIRRNIRRELRKEALRSPEAPSEAAAKFITYATTQIHTKARTDGFENVRRLWPDYVLGLEQWYYYASAGTGLDQAHRFLQYLEKFPGIPAREKASAWTRIVETYAARGVINRAQQCLHAMAKELPDLPARELDLSSNNELPDFKKDGQPLLLRDTWKYRWLYARAVIAVASVYSSVYRFDEAREVCREALAEFPDDETYIQKKVGDALAGVDISERLHRERMEKIARQMRPNSKSKKTEN